MNLHYLGCDYGKEGENVLGGDELTASMVDTCVKQSMPICMSQLHAKMKRDLKLKHFGTLQFGLFLE